ncbi:MAG: alpha-L-arabinofuranosidase [Anaerolineae bacterium]|nr:alpha-L-arabinofuranosidase [Anaerolineae bacterium]
MQSHPAYLIALPLIVALHGFISTAHAASDVVVYTDALASGWSSNSWDATYALNNALPARGTASIAITYTSGWGGVIFCTSPALDSALYEAVTLWVHGGTSGPARQLRFFVQEVPYGSAFATSFTAPINQWTPFTFTLSALGNPAEIVCLSVMNDTANPQPTFYVDDIRIHARAAPLSLTTTITVSTNVTPVAISPYLRATNLPAWLGPTRLADATFRARTRAAGLTLLRMPGGSWSNTYGWLSCELGQNAPDRQDCGTGWHTWAARPRDFIAFLKATGLEGMWVVSPMGTSKEAAALVAYFNGDIHDNRAIGTDIRGTDWYTVGHWARLRAAAGYTEPIGIRYWEFGNEVYASKPSTGGSLCQPWGWEETWTCDGYEYVFGKDSGSTRREGYLEFRAAMKAVDPTIQVGAVGFEWPGTPSDGQSSWQTFAGWGARVISAAGNNLDLYTIHPYPFFNPPTLVGALANPQTHLTRIVNAIHGAFDAYAGGRRAPIAVTEFNLIAVQDQDNSQLMTRMVNALFLADSLGQAARLGIPIFAQWDLANGRAANGTEYGLMHEDNNYFRAPQYYVYPLWARFGNQMLSATHTLSPSTQLSVYAGRVNANTLSLMAINKTGSPITATILVSGFGPLIGGAVWEVRASSLDAQSVLYNGSSNPSDTLSEPPMPLTASGSVLTYTLPPYSISLLHLHQASPRVWLPLARRP